MRSLPKILVIVILLAVSNAGFATCPATDGSDLDNNTFTITSGDGSCATINLGGGNFFSDNLNITIENGGTLTINTGQYWVLFPDCTITVENGGTLIVNGTGGGLSVDDGSALIINTGGVVNIGGPLDVGDYVGGNGRTGDITVDGTLTVGGDFNMNQNSTLDGGGSITVTGDYIEEDGSVSSTGYSGSASCSSGCESLPVKLSSFQATEIENDLVTFEWITATELNNDGFFLEKSLDNKHFDQIAFIPGNGTTNEIQTYGFTDHKFSQSSYYRLKQVDYDGQFEYHPVIFVRHQTEQKLSLAQNPVTTNISLIGSNKIEYSAVLLNISGQQLSNHHRMGLPDIQNELNQIVGSLEPAVYILRISSAEGIQSIRFIKN